jgi:hypothetical protein
MKKFKIIIALLIVITSQYSCQSEEIVAAKGVTQVKKTPLPDGIPSDADDMYEFDKSQYYHNNKLLTDTTQIKNLLNNCRLLHIDGTKKTICVTDQEKALLNQKLNIDNNISAKTNALDGDNFMHYFYEIHRDNSSGVGSEFYYFNKTGPHYINAVGNNFTVHFYKRLDDISNPSFKYDFTMQTGESINDLLSHCEKLPGIYIAGNLLHWNCFYTINVINTTRFKRLVTFQAIGGSIIQMVIEPKKRGQVGGRRQFHRGVIEKFNAIDNFRLNAVYSQKM